MKTKLISLLLIIILICVPSVGCKKSVSKEYTIKIASLKGPTSMGLAKLYTDSDSNLTKQHYQYSIHTTADEIVTQLAKGELDLAAIPCNVASVLYNKTNGNVKVVGINTLGVLYILEKGTTSETISDLKGKTIYTTGQGTTPEYTLKHMLSLNGLDPEKDVNIEFLSEATEVAAKTMNLENAVLMLPEPFVTVAMTQDSSLVKEFDVSKEWENASSDSTGVVTGVIVASSDFINNHENELKSFLSEYKASVDYCSNNLDEAAKLMENLDIVKAAIARKALPFCNITLITGEDMQNRIASYLDVLFESDAKSIGGKLPDSNFYYVN